MWKDLCNNVSEQFYRTELFSIHTTKKLKGNLLYVFMHSYIPTPLGITHACKPTKFIITKQFSISLSPYVII